MIDRPLIRRTQPIDPRLDQWMLDRWSDPSQHVVSVVYRDRKVTIERQTFIDRDYRSLCQCGWRSIETPAAPSKPEPCPVAVALAERVARYRKPSERLEWNNYRMVTP